jgi:hypothetical protein
VAGRKWPGAGPDRIGRFKSQGQAGKTVMVYPLPPIPVAPVVAFTTEDPVVTWETEV